MWKEKVKLNDLFKFCEIPKTRKEIKEKFNLTPIESWHCCKYLNKLTYDMLVEKKVGMTGRAYLYQTRKHRLEKLKYI